MNTSTEKLTYFLYARKSSESEDRQVQSIPDQVTRLAELSESLHIEIKEVLIESRSAKKPHCRPVFAEMLKRIEKGEANGILCWQINRLFRNPVDFGTISWMLQQNILKSIQTIDRKYLPDDNVLLLNVEGGMANQYIIDLRKNSRRGMIGKAERGWLPSRAPLGYINEKLEHTIIPDPDRFLLVRKMWDLMLTGNYTPPAILKIANTDWGFRTPKSKRQGGKEICNSEIYQLFGNIFYTGRFYWDGQLYDGNHKPMITLEEYDRVQFLLGRKGRHRPKTHQFAYTGIMRCGTCGRMITATKKTKFVKATAESKSYIYYHCSHKDRNKCGQKERMTLMELEDQIEGILERVTIHPQFLEWGLEKLDREKTAKSAKLEQIRITQEQSVQIAEQELTNLIRMRYRELIDDEDFIYERNKLKIAIEKAKEQVSAPEKKLDQSIELTLKALTFATYARNKFSKSTLEEKREIFSTLGQNFTVFGKKLVVELNEFLIPIEKSYPELYQEYQRLELEKNLSDTTRDSIFSQLILTWLAVVEDVRTAHLK